MADKKYRPLTLPTMDEFREFIGTEPILPAFGAIGDAIRGHWASLVAGSAKEPAAEVRQTAETDSQPIAELDLKALRQQVERHSAAEQPDK